MSSRRPSTASTVTTTSRSMSTTSTPGSSTQPSPFASSISIPVPEQPEFCEHVQVLPSSTTRASRFSEALRRAKRRLADDDVDGLDFNPAKSLQPSKLSWHTI
ncbi:hypothetical protein CspHIS471_0610000 [Cutaneotrichosporon sp. HIS471]|nr:hypothetical protein CspHIS471_0610000 [Cutaneotrichosporon sp. HIS471]